MKVLLVQAFTALDMELVYPLGPASLAAHLEGHDVRILDLNLHRDEPHPALERAMGEHQPDVVGFSLRNMKVGMPHLHTDDIDPQREAIAVARRVAPGIPILAGGTAFSLYSRPIMERIPEIDLGVWGEAETRLPALLEKLAAPWEIPGVFHRRDGELLYSGDPPPVEFSDIRPPRRDLCSLEPYGHPVSVGVQSKRGCRLRCLHCSDTWLTGSRLRMRSPAQVADEVEELVWTHGVQEFFFCDQVFNIPPEHARGICRELIRRRVPVTWGAWFNEAPEALPEDLLPWLREAGCRLLSFSPDAADDRMLRRLRKNTTEADLHRTYRLARQHGFDVEYSFFLNAPGEDLRSMAQVVLFLAKARAHLGPRLRLFSLLLMQPIRIYPHTAIQRLALEEGLIEPGDDLVRGRYWNPPPLDKLVSGVQAGARVLYAGRQALRRDATVRPGPPPGPPGS